MCGQLSTAVDSSVSRTENWDAERAEAKRANAASKHRRVGDLTVPLIAGGKPVRVDDNARYTKWEREHAQQAQASRRKRKAKRAADRDR
jgi:hypothetical protein